MRMAGCQLPRTTCRSAAVLRACSPSPSLPMCLFQHLLRDRELHGSFVRRNLKAHTYPNELRASRPLAPRHVDPQGSRRVKQQRQVPPSSRVGPLMIHIGSIHIELALKSCCVDRRRGLGRCCRPRWPSARRTIEGDRLEVGVSPQDQGGWQCQETRHHRFASHWWLWQTRDKIPKMAEEGQWALDHDRPEGGIYDFELITADLSDAYCHLAVHPSEHANCLSPELRALETY